MTAKEYLSQVKKIEQEIASKKRLLQKLRYTATNLSSPTFGDKVKSSPKDSNIVDKIIELENIIERKELELIDKIAEINTNIELVCNPVLIAVLTDKYVNGISLSKIAENMNKAERTVQVWHGQALQIFRKETGMK